MNFYDSIRKQNELSKAQVEALTGRNELQNIIDTLVKAGVPEDQFIEKAKYIRREGSKGNYKYIYDEEKEGSEKKKNKDLEITEGKVVGIKTYNSLKNINENVDVKITKIVNRPGQEPMVHFKMLKGSQQGKERALAYKIFKQKMV